MQSTPIQYCICIRDQKESNPRIAYIRQEIRSSIARRNKLKQTYKYTLLIISIEYEKCKILPEKS